MRAQEFIPERKKKKSSRSTGGYFFPGYGYYGTSDSGEGGGDGGGESVDRGMAEGVESLDDLTAAYQHHVELSRKYRKKGNREKDQHHTTQAFNIIQQIWEHPDYKLEFTDDPYSSQKNDALSMKHDSRFNEQGVAEGSDFFAGSKFADEDGNTFSVEKIIAFAKKNPKYFHKDFPLSKIKHDLSWWQGNKERMMNADTSFPLLVIQNDDGHLGVADGLNRMKKAVDVEKKTTIDVYLVPKKDIMKFSEKQGMTEGSNDTIYANAEVIKSKNGKPVGEIYQDGNSWGAFHYRADRGYDLIDSREEAIEALRELHQETGRSGPDYTIKGVTENFADGKNPQDKGDAKRHGINTKASVSSLRKTAKQGGRKGQLAHWLANMKSGRAKKK
jgi:hypothetical protein